jgi:hypothetical protein
MEIETFVIIAVVAIVAAIVGFLATRRLGASRASDDIAVFENVPAASVNQRLSSIATPATSPSRQFAPVDDPTIAGDLVVLGGNGEVMLSCREIDYLPPRGDLDDGKHDAALNRAMQLATELITRSMMLPGKTVEITFDPVIQRGLSSGAYEMVKVAPGDGQRLMARAIDSKKFVGHGRFMEVGKLKQLGVGAFHIVSIAVAQAHLAEINKNLKEIKESVKDIRGFFENKDKSQLTATVEYLQYVVNFIRRMDSPDRLPIEKRVEIERIRREMMGWVAQIVGEADQLHANIEGQSDVDGWGGGTGNTFGKLKEHARAVERLIHTYRLLLRTASLFYMTSAYFDPMALRDRDVTRILQPDAATNALLRALQQLGEKSKTLLGSAVWNTAETLRLRQQYMEQEVRQLDGQTCEEKKFFADGMGRLERQLSRIGDPQGNVRMAISFDSAGNPEHVKLV